jgi:hypothetical protein
MSRASSPDRPRRSRWSARGRSLGHLTFAVPRRDDGGIVHVGRGLHHRGLVRRHADLGADGCVIGALAILRDDLEPRVVSGGFATLVVDQDAHLIALPAIARFRPSESNS